MSPQEQAAFGRFADSFDDSPLPLRQRTIQMAQAFWDLTLWEAVWPEDLRTLAAQIVPNILAGGTIKRTLHQSNETELAQLSDRFTTFISQYVAAYQPSRVDATDLGFAGDGMPKPGSRSQASVRPTVAAGFRPLPRP